MKLRNIAVLGSTVFLCLGQQARGQSGWWARYEAREAATLVNQPHWATPLVTTNPRVEQGFRADFTRQTTTTGRSTWNDGGTKGLQFLPLPRAEFEISPPPFFIHNYRGGLDGFGDVAFRVKVRAYGSNEEHHNGIVSLLLNGSVPTGKQANGSCCAIMTPQVEVGKGFGAMTLIGSVAGTLPASNTTKLGRSVVWNNATQYRTLKLVWFEFETSTTIYFGGSNDGKEQTFVTPGVVVSRMPLLGKSAALPNGLQLTLGGGEQIAVTHFHTYQRATVLSGRLRF